MLRWIALSALVFIVSCWQGDRWQGDGVSLPLGPVTPGSYVAATADDNVAPFTSLTIAPSATMPVIGADLQAFELALLNSQHGTVNFAALPNATGYPDGARAFVRGFNGGWYRRVAAGTGFASDGLYLVDSLDGGQWTHQNWLEARALMTPAIGPMPGETTTNPTSAGRINGQFIPFGHYFSVGVAPATFTTVSTVTLTNANGAPLGGTYDLGTLAAGDYVFAHINAVAFSASTNGYEVAVYISFDNGATWTIVTPANNAATGVPLIFDQTGTGVANSIDLSFVKAVTAGHCKVQIRGASISGGTLTVAIGSGFIQVRRT